MLPDRQPRAGRRVYGAVSDLTFHLICETARDARKASLSVSKKWQSHFFEFCKSSQPEVVWICKELILQAKSTTRETGKAGLHDHSPADGCVAQQNNCFFCSQDRSITASGLFLMQFYSNSGLRYAPPASSACCSAAGSTARTSFLSAASAAAVPAACPVM